MTFGDCFPTQNCLDGDSSSLQKVNYVASIGYGHSFTLAPTFNIYKETPYTTEPDYSYNKAAAIGYMRYMASLYAKHEIRFNTVCPGGIFSNQDPNFIKNYTSTIPIKKMADASDIGGIVSFLCSPNSSYITGTVIPVDGGWTAQ